MNLVVLTGRLTRDPELKYGQSGKAYCRFSLAVDRAFQKGEADFINCVAFGKTAELVGEYLRKGRKTGVQGRLQMNRYEMNGEKRTTYDVMVDNIEFLESRSSASDNNFGANSYSESGYSKSQPSGKQAAHSEPEVDFEDDDEFPF
jgi:single-strand DNA-binding protein